jgi:Tfp pilus assembly protein PilN
MIAQKNPLLISRSKELQEKFSNASGTPTQSGGSAGLSVLIDVAINFGVSYLSAKSENRKNEQLLKRMAELDDKQAEKLKKLIQESATELAKTKVIFDFLAEEDAKKLEAQRKKERILPIIGLCFGVILFGLVFYKLHKQNKNE